MESSSSDEDDCQLPFWNNWVPPSNNQPNQSDSNEHKKTTRKIFSNPFLFSTKTIKYGNWIPPVNFLNQNVKIKPQTKEEKTVFDQKQIKKIETPSNECVTFERREENKKTELNDFVKNIKPDWKKITQLHDLTGFNDGDLIWGVVNLGLFVHIKLWINQYGIICGTADGKISKLGCAETTFISVTNLEILRKILCLSTAQWASLCETVEETKSTLKFDAFEDFNMAGKTSLEKLWFFLCKRRHLCPDQYMLVKLCGAVKCMRTFNIIPKVVVQETRTIFEI